MSKESSVFIFSGSAQVASGTRHGKICHAFQIGMEQLMEVSRDDVPDAIFLRQFMKGKVRILKDRGH